MLINVILHYYIIMFFVLKPTSLTSKKVNHHCNETIWAPVCNLLFKSDFNSY